MSEVLDVKVHLHRNGHWSVYMRLPDGSTESCRGMLDVRNVDSLIWRELCAMASDSHETLHLADCALPGDHDGDCVPAFVCDVDENGGQA